MALTVCLRTATEADSEALAAIEQESFPDPSWTAPDFLKYDCLVAEAISEEERVIAGFLVSREIDGGTPETPPEREILNLAVADAYRRSGIASRLLACELKRGSVVFLEVRESNVSAINLYKKAGFTDIFRRREYYDHPMESAIVMRMKW